MDRRQEHARRWLAALTARQVNLALLVLVLVAMASGAVAFGLGTRWVVAAIVVHDLVGLGLLVLVPAKVVIVRRGLARRRASSTWPSVVLGVLVVLAVVSGILRSLGLVLTWGPLDDMQVHVGAGLMAVPFAAWHAWARDTRPARRDLTRRTLVRGAALVGAGAVLLAGAEAVQRLVGLPGSRRRFTGSFEQASHDPAAMPSIIWLFDPRPDLDPDPWRLVVGDANGTRRLALDDLAGFDDRVTAVLDCTSGWWSEQDWRGVRLDRLVAGSTTADGRPARSARVISATGYSRRFPLADLPGLVLATHYEGRPLAARHGFPARLVAPGRRGFWWVKWVDRIELDPLPSWRQPPFPLQ